METTMLQKETFISTSFGRLYAQYWLPSENTKALLILVHGLGEHTGRYQHVAEKMVQAGFGLFAFELPGHGRSPGKRGHIPSYASVYEAIDQSITVVREMAPEKPIFIYGHSLGGNLVLSYFTECQPNVNGAIVTSPGLGTGVPVPGIKMFAGRVLYHLAPSFQMDNGLDLNYLSHDPSIKEAYKKDPLVHPLISARLGMDMLDHGNSLLQQKGHFPVPLLLMQGSGEQIVDPQKTIQFANNHDRNIELKVWVDQYHELHNETNKNEVLDFMINWLNQHLNSSGE
jgi:alpha-beta hydrolase superfamily lysophospholipase